MIGDEIKKKNTQKNELITPEYPVKATKKESNAKEEKRIIKSRLFLLL